MPGTRHAKNNTALGFFTKHERDRLQWGTKRMRLGKDSIKKFDACTICLKLCVSPMICPRGDLFCKECIYESLLNQKHRIKKQMIDYETLRVEKEQKKEENERKEAIDKFMKFDKLETSVVLDNIARNEETSMLIAKQTSNSNNNNNSNSNDNITNNTNNNNEISDKDAKSLLEAPNPRDKQLGCFWIPQLTPNTKDNDLLNDSKKLELKTNKLHCYCPGCNQTLKLKNLISVKFTLAAQDVNDIKKSKLSNTTKNKSNKADTNNNSNSKNSSQTFRSGLGATIQSVSVNNEKRFVCPCCNKVLTNAMKIACLKRCGHVLCLKCVGKFVSQNKCCTVCSEPCRKKKDIILLAVGGTGYSGHGNQMQSVKSDVAFQ